MAFLDFIKNRNASRQQPVADHAQAQKPETARQMYAREAAQDKAAEKPITPEIKAYTDRALAAITKATQHISPQAPPPASDGGTQAAQLQKQHNQDKTQAALSPTDGTVGKTALQEMIGDN